MVKIFLLLILVSDVQYKSPQKAVILSALLPGGGQFYTGHYIKGGVIASGEIFSLIKAYFLYKDSKDYEVGSSERDSLMRESFSYAFWFLGIWFYSVLDAYVDAHLYNFDEKAKISIFFKPDNEAVLFGIKISYEGFR